MDVSSAQPRVSDEAGDRILMRRKIRPVPSLDVAAGLNTGYADHPVRAGWEMRGMSTLVAEKPVSTGPRLGNLSHGEAETMQQIRRWVAEMVTLTRPDEVIWCDGNDAEYERLIDGMLADNTLIELNQKEFPGCYLHRSNPNDV